MDRVSISENSRSETFLKRVQLFVRYDQIITGRETINIIIDVSMSLFDIKEILNLVNKSLTMLRIEV